MDWVNCSFCGKKYFKDTRHINENLKLGHNFFCSPVCQYSFKNKQKQLICENKNCRNKFKRALHSISPHNFCSRSCAAIINNVKFPRKTAEIRKCCYCNNKPVKHKKYCSVECKSSALTISSEKVIEVIRGFYKKYHRIPVKREMWGIYKPARKYFKTWNNAIEVAGFDSNPVLFSKHQIAEDGHVCDSIAEMIIDDYLYEKGILHERAVSYPGGIYTADFKVGGKFVEYFGLAGEHKRYDELRRIKQKIAEKCKLELIEIYPKDLYPKNKLASLLSF